MSYSCDKTPVPGSKPEFVADLNHQTLADAFVLCLCCWRPNTKSLLETTDAQKIVLRRWFESPFGGRFLPKNVLPMSSFVAGSRTRLFWGGFWETN